MRTFHVYILASRSGVLYVGVTNDLVRRMAEHKAKRIPGFTARYNVHQLVWNEAFRDVWQAIAAEKKIKGWSRQKKIDLVVSKNPMWSDLSEGWPGLPQKGLTAEAMHAVIEPHPPARDPSAAPLDDRGGQRP